MYIHIWITVDAQSLQKGLLNHFVLTYKYGVNKHLGLSHVLHLYENTVKEKSKIC